MARQKLGQHFLGDDEWREEIARAIRVSPFGMQPEKKPDPQANCWIEVGAGHGEMTEHLLQSGLPVYAVELDTGLAAGLQRMARKQPRLRVVAGDILETDLSALAAGRRMRIYGNLPYYITSPILHRLFEYAEQIDEISILIQDEVALRLTAKPGGKSYGYLSVLTQFYSRPEWVMKIPRAAFRPPPEVESALVTLRLPAKPRGILAAETPAFLEFVKSCFAQKRKTLANNLRSAVRPERFREIVEELKLRPDARAEQLGIEEFAALYRAIS
jgi:16S rRNA (adenine1518-N6/adenine1519-N6)-dimethyltransferase